jgi:hypothetical protein
VNSELAWFKSSYSTGDGGDCVEVAFGWRTSSYSTGSGGDCVEVAACPHRVHVRDSKNTARGSFQVSPGAWSAFLRALPAR